MAGDAAAPPSERVAGADEAPRLSSTSPPPRDRITEYENALAPTPKKNSEGVIFKVVKQARKSGDKGSSITDLPNEVLTHALSHLSPNDLAAVSLVSRRFNELVTTPHAWMVAFARYFPGPESLLEQSERDAMDDNGDVIRTEKRSFTRLTALASWRSEYILRTRLLRSLVRGRPLQMPSSTPPRPGQTQTIAPVIMYSARTYTTINHIHATFGWGLNKKEPRLIHGADDVGMVTSSDPITGRVDPWGESDPVFFSQFTERFPGDAEWGLGAGEVVGRPNVMDVSQPNGMIYGQGCPEGMCYYRSLDQMRGQYIAPTVDFSRPSAGMPNLGVDAGAICSVWIAKSSAIPTLSEGLIGMMTGSAAGVVTACSLGNDGVRGHRLQRGELTARWVLSPGVPIIAIAVDDNYSTKRQAQNRIWAVALNALGELFYLNKFPTRSQTQRKDMDLDEHTEYLAWLTGRSVYWNLVEPSRRVARPDPYQESSAHGSYSPRSSWNGMGLSEDQISAETKEIQQYLHYLPKHFRKVCLRWDMRRRLEVDFAGDDETYAGEALVVFGCGLEDGSAPDIKRYTRWRTREKRKDGPAPTRADHSQLSQPVQSSSLFGGAVPFATPLSTSSDQGKVASEEDHQRQPSTPVLPNDFDSTRRSSYVSSDSSPERANYVEEWRLSHLSFGGLRNVQLTTTALDNSTFATLTMSEDPALGFSTASTASSPYASPMSVASQPSSSSDIPGQRARFVTAGTRSGIILIWNIRSPVSRSSTLINKIEPIRIIYTESPEISSLALTALHLVHGGNDGLVQAWDVLASTTQPVKTLNSRFSSRARRRLVQAQASVQGVGINMYAAGAICLDPDPTSLRGVVSLGNQIRCWSYSSSAADQFKGSKRRLRHAERGSNHTGFSGSGRPNLKGYIENEKYELERDQQERRRHAERLAGRFGVDLLDDEDEALAYATLLSQEALEDEKRRSENQKPNARSAEPQTPEPSIANDEEIDADLAEAIRLSLQEQESPDPDDSGFDIPIKYAKGLRSPSLEGKSPAKASSSREKELSDLEFALQLSLAEEQSRKEAEAEMDGFPALSWAENGKGKGKGRMM